MQMFAVNFIFYFFSMRQTLRQIVAVLALAGLAMSLVPNALAATYTDLSAANKLATAGIIVDKSATPAAYRLGDTLLRQEGVGTAAKALGIIPDAPVADYTCAGKFSDISEAWVCRAAELAAKAGLTNAANKTFRPKDNLTKYEAMLFALKSSCADISDRSVSGVAAYAAEAGIITNAASFNGTAAATRGEFFRYVATAMEDSACGDTSDEDVLCTLFPDLCVDDGGTDVPTTGGDLEVSEGSAPFAAGTTLPSASGITVGSIDITAGSDDAVITAVRLISKGVGARTDIVSVGLFSDGVKVAKSKAISSEDLVDLNMISPLKVEAGETVTLDVVVSTAAAAGEHYFQVESDGITTNSGSVDGNFPVTTPLFKTSTTVAGTLTFSADGSLADVKLGQTDAILAKFKVATNGVEDITINSMTFKKDSVSTAQDGDVENLTLYMNGSEVATGELVNRYVTFNVDKTILKNKSDQKFEIRGDIVGGASKTLKLVIDSTTDVSASGSKYLYGANTAGTGTVAATVTITAGAVSLVKEDAVIDKVLANKQNVLLGKIKITPNSGKDVELSTLKLTIDTTLDSAVAAATAFGEIENLELYNETTSQVYDLTYVAGGTNSKVYSNTDMGAILKSGTTYTLAVRADTKAVGTAVDGDYVVKLASAATDLVMKEVANDTLVTDITPNALSLKKVAVSTSGFTVTQNALSSALNAVIGSDDVELINFNVKANDVGDLKIRELKFAKEAAASTLNNTLVSGFKLYQMVGSTWTLVKSVGTSDLAGNEVTVRDLAVVVPVNTTAKFKLTTSLVKDTGNNNKTLLMRVSGYSVEDKDGTSIYAVAVDGDSNGVITAAQAGATSARTVTVKSTGTATLTTDVLDSVVSKDSNVVAGTTSGFIGAYKIAASNEGVAVKDLTVTFSADVSASVDSVILYKGDKTTEIAREAVTGAAVTFTSIPSYVVAEGTETLYVKVVTRKIGKNEAGVISLNRYLTSAEITRAEGASSGDPVTIAISNTDTKNFSVVPVKLSTVTFVASNGGESVVASNSLSSGVSQIVGIVAVTADTHSNTNSGGSPLKLALTNLEYSLAGTATYAGIKITKIGGADSDGQASNAPTGANSYFDMTALTSGDNLIESGQTVYYKIEATPTVGAGLSVQLSLPNLDSAAANAGIDYDTDAGSQAVNILNIGMTTVTGPTLSRPN